MNIGEKILGANGTEFIVDEILASGSQGDAFRVKPTARNRNEIFVIKLYKKHETDRYERLKAIIEHGHLISKGFPEKTFCFPIDFVTHKNIDGIVMPCVPETAIQMSTLFETPQNSPQSPDAFNLVISGKVKYKTFVLNAFHLARAVNKLYREGFTHCDLSINNMFIDTSNGHISIIDLDNLAVQNFLPAKVAGTPGYAAPELDNNKTIPDHTSDAHSLAVLIFNLLMFRHPLVGSNMNVDWADNPFGTNALYTEHPKDNSNRFTGGGFDISDLPLFIQNLFNTAFIEGLHNNKKRDSTEKWIKPMWNFIESMYVCDKCQQTTWFTNKNVLNCLFCGHKNEHQFAMLNFSNGFNKLVKEKSVLYPHHFFRSGKDYDLSDRLVDFKLSNNGHLVFANRSKYNIEVELSNGMKKNMARNQGVILSGVKKIHFSKSHFAEVELF
jgi:serine/threonine protein kinase